MFSTTSLQCTFILCSLSYTLQLTLSSNCASSIVFLSQKQFAVSCTGYRLTNRLSINSVCWYTNASITGLHHTCRHTVCRSHPSQLVLTCGLQPRAIWIFHVQELLHLVLVVLQFLDLRVRAGTLYPHPWNHHPCNLNNSGDNWRRLSWRRRRNSVTRLSAKINL